MQMLVPIGIAIYTCNFGRWMKSRKNKSGAYGAYAIAAVALGVSIFALLRHNL